MIPAIQHHDATVYLGDARTVLEGLPAGSVQCIVTSPPYYGLRDYGHPGQLGLEPSPAEYVAAMVAVFAEARRVLAADGVMWLNLGDSYASGPIGKQNGACGTGGRVRGDLVLSAHRPGTDVPPKNLLGIPWRVAFALQDDGWTLRNAVIWAKPNAMPESVTDRLSTRYEHVFLFSKSRRYWFDLDAIREATITAPHKIGDKATAAAVANGWKHHGRVDGELWDDRGRNPGDVWTIPTTPYPGAHFAVFPAELARRCILAGCPEGGTVLDPFTGSGTTAMVARQLGRRFVGAELNPAYVPLIEKRIGQEPFDFGEALA
jgi:DNA modification methylase